MIRSYKRYDLLNDEIREARRTLSLFDENSPEYMDRESELILMQDIRAFGAANELVDTRVSVTACKPGMILPILVDHHVAEEGHNVDWQVIENPVGLSFDVLDAYAAVHLGEEMQPDVANVLTATDIYKDKTISDDPVSVLLVVNAEELVFNSHYRL